MSESARLLGIVGSAGFRIARYPVLGDIRNNHRYNIQYSLQYPAIIFSPSFLREIKENKLFLYSSRQKGFLISSELLTIADNTLYNTDISHKITFQVWSGENISLDGEFYGYHNWQMNVQCVHCTSVQSTDLTLHHTNLIYCTLTDTNKIVLCGMWIVILFFRTNYKTIYWENTKLFLVSW